jgi:repressor LexA
MNELSQKQQRCLSYLAQEIKENGFAPSLRQAAHDLGVSHAAVAQQIKILTEKGYVIREGHYSRDIKILQKGCETSGDPRLRETPIVGGVAAGLPMYAQQEWDGSILLDTDHFRGDNLFSLRVKGDSMQKAGILSGDLVICEPRQFARNGEIVVALIHDEEATVKRFYLKESWVELHPENDAFTVMTYGFEEVMVQGKVVGVIRTPEMFN